RKQIQRSNQPRPNAVTRQSGTSAPKSKNVRFTESITSDSSRYAGSASEATALTAKNAIEIVRSEAPGTRPTSGRAIRMRRTKSPIAVITVRNAIQRATSNGVDVAVFAMCGMTNCGGGPGLGPTANVNAPWTGWPSTEMARQ